MITTKLFRAAFLMLCVVGILNFLAVKFYFYWSIHWFDSIVHFLAGVTVALAVLVFWQQMPNRKPIEKVRVLWIGVLGAIAIGLLWEVYELLVGVTTFADGIHYWTDTGSDLLMDTVGGLLGSMYGYKILSNTTNE